MTTRVSPNACINRWSVRQSSPGRWLAGLLPGRLAGDARDECLVCEPRPSRVVSVSVSPRRRVAERSPPFSGINSVADDWFITSHYFSSHWSHFIIKSLLRIHLVRTRMISEIVELDSLLLSVKGQIRRATVEWSVEKQGRCFGQ